MTRTLPSRRPSPSERNSLNPAYELRSIEEIDGLSGPPRTEPQWEQYDWPEAEGLDRDHLETGRFGAACRLDRNQQGQGWWALGDLIAVICGHHLSFVPGTGWYLVRPADLIKVMTAFRMIGADSRLEVCLPPEYVKLVKLHARNSDELVRAAAALSREARPA